MKKIKLFSLIFMMLASIFMLFQINSASASVPPIQSMAEIELDAEINSKQTVVRFIITSKGVSLNEIDSIELKLKKDGVASKRQIFIETVYTSISNASKDYVEDANTYYGIVNITDVKSISGSTINANVLFTYTDNTTKTLDEDKIINIPTISPYTREDNYIYFGSYPQTKVTNDAIKTTLDNMAGTPLDPKDNYTWIDYGYYASNEKAEYMYYIDIDLNNDDINDYRGVYFTQYRPSFIDQAAIASKSEQDENGYLINTTYWFKYEPIKWDILNIKDGKALISTSTCIDSQHYVYAKGLSTTEPSSHNGYDNRFLNNYEASDIRIWLNDTFYNTAFDAADKKLINETTVDNGYDSLSGNQKKYINEHPSFNTEAYYGNNTKDNVFLLSFAETSKYYNNADLRKYGGTDYTISQGFKYYSTTKSADNWSRTPGLQLHCASYVTRSGNIVSGYDNFEMAVTGVNGIKPALVIDLETFDLNVSVVNSQYGSVDSVGESKHAYGESITLTATPNENYSLDGWYANDKLVSTDTTYTFEMPNENLNLEARFTYYTLTTSIDDEDAGIVTSYDSEKITTGTEVSISIELEDGYSLVGWYANDELVSENESFTYTMPNENVEMVAKTTRYTLTVDNYLVNGFENAKKVTFDSNGGNKINSQYSNNIMYPIPTKEGYTFVGWYDNQELTGDVFDFNSTINSDITLYAKWIENDSNYSNVGYGNNNRVEINSNGANFSNYFRFVAFVDGNINFWSYFHYVTDYAIIEIYDANKELIEAFDQVNPGFSFLSKSYECKAGDIFYVRFKPSRLWYGYDTMSIYAYFEHNLPNKGYDYASTTRYDNAYYKAGTKVTLTATNKNDTTFLGWYDGDDNLLSENNKYTLTMPSSNFVVYAKYAYYTLTLINDKSDAGTIPNYNNKRFIAGNDVTITATTNDGYSFLGWYDLNDNLVSDKISYKFEMPNESLTYVAKFKAVSVVLNKSIEEAGEVSISENLEYGKDATITATVVYGYIFAGWYDSNNTKLTNELTYTFTLGDSHEFMAMYYENNISIIKNLEDSGEISDFEFGYILGDQLELTFEINPGYTWYGWYLNGEKVSSEKTITIDITLDNNTYEAKCGKYVLTIESNIEDALKDYTTITYDSMGGSEVATQNSDNVKYVIPTKENYVFAGWYDNENCEGNPYDFTQLLTDSITLYAKWVEASAPAFPVNTRSYIQLPSGDEYGSTGSKRPAAWYSFYTMCAGEVNFKIEGIDQYGYNINVYEADKSTVVLYADSAHGTFVDETFTVEANKIYYLVLRQHYINAYSRNRWMTLTMELPEVACNTSKNGDIIVAGENVKLFAEANEGYTFTGWYLNNELITTNHYYSFVMPEASVTYEARYTRNQVTYTVNHYKQNVDDDDYTLVTEDIQVLNGYTGNDTEAVAMNYTGFTAVEFEQAKVNGDNSTVINIYYNRNNYNLTTSVQNITNESNAGSVDITNQSYRYGKSVTVTATPNAGYQFVGWYNNNAEVSTDAAYTFNMPYNALALVAKFEAIKVNYDVEYWLENIYDNDFTKDKTVTLTGYSGNLTEAVVDTYDDFVSPSITQVEIAGDGSTVITLKYKRRTVNKVAYEIYFELHNDAKYGTLIVQDGFTRMNSVDNSRSRYYVYKDNVKVGYEILPQINAVDNYELEGWYLNNADRLDGSEITGFKYVVSLDDINSNGYIWLVAKVNATYKVQYYYQNNVDEWVENGEIIDQGRTYDAETITYDRKGIILENTTESVDTLIEIQDGFEIYNISNIMLDSINEAVNVYCIPKKYKLWFDREYDYVPFPTYDGEMAPVYGEDTYVELYYGQTSKVISTEGPESSEVAFVGWYVVKDGVIYGDALSTELTTTFKMRAMDIVVVPIFSIEYELEVHKDGEVTTETRVGNIGFTITPDYYEGYSVYTLIYYSGSSTLNWYCLQSSNNRVLVEYKKD